MFSKRLNDATPSELDEFCRSLNNYPENTREDVINTLYVNEPEGLAKLILNAVYIERMERESNIPESRRLDLANFVRPLLSLLQKRPEEERIKFLNYLPQLAIPGEIEKAFDYYFKLANDDVQYDKTRSYLLLGFLLSCGIRKEKLIQAVNNTVSFNDGKEYFIKLIDKPTLSSEEFAEFLALAFRRAMEPNARNTIDEECSLLTIFLAKIQLQQQDEKVAPDRRKMEILSRYLAEAASRNQKNSTLAVNILITASRMVGGLKQEEANKALGFAIKNKNSAMVVMLMDAGARLERGVLDPNYDNFFIRALLKTRDPETRKSLLKAKNNIQHFERFCYATRQFPEAELLSFLTRFAEVEYKPSNISQNFFAHYGNMVLQASQNRPDSNDLRMLRILVESNPLQLNPAELQKILSYKDEMGNTAFHLAVMRNDLETLDTLRDAQVADNNTLPQKNNEGNTALHLAVLSNADDKTKFEMIKKLLASYPKLTEERNNNGETAYQIALKTCPVFITGYLNAKTSDRAKITPPEVKESDSARKFKLTKEELKANLKLISGNNLKVSEMKPHEIKAIQAVARHYQAEGEYGRAMFFSALAAISLPDDALDKDFITYLRKPVAARGKEKQILEFLQTFLLRLEGYSDKLKQEHPNVDPITFMLLAAKKMPRFSDENILFTEVQNKLDRSVRRALKENAGLSEIETNDLMRFKQNTIDGLVPSGPEIEFKETSDIAPPSPSALKIPDNLRFALQGHASHLEWMAQHQIPGEKTLGGYGPLKKNYGRAMLFSFLAMVYGDDPNGQFREYITSLSKDKEFLATRDPSLKTLQLYLKTQITGQSSDNNNIENLKAIKNQYNIQDPIVFTFVALQLSHQDEVYKRIEQSLVALQKDMGIKINLEDKKNIAQLLVSEIHNNPRNTNEAPAVSIHVAASAPLEPPPPAYEDKHIPPSEDPNDLPPTYEQALAEPSAPSLESPSLANAGRVTFWKRAEDIAPSAQASQNTQEAALDPKAGEKQRRPSNGK